MIATAAAGEEPRLDFRVLSVITRLATDPGSQYKGADIICEREAVWAQHQSRSTSMSDWIKIHWKKTLFSTYVLSNTFSFALQKKHEFHICKMCQHVNNHKLPH